MKILFDYQAFYYQRFGGISNSFVKLISNFPQNVSYKISVEESNNIHLLESDIINRNVLKDISDSTIYSYQFKGHNQLYRWTSRLFPRSTSLGRNQLNTIKDINQGDFDVFHPTFFDTYFVDYLKKPFVLTVHDMIPELFDGKKSLQAQNKSFLVDKASHIVAVSNNTKKDLMEILKIPDEKITVIYHGAPDGDFTHTKQTSLEKPYILYVGLRDGYKSFRLMVKHLSSIFRKYSNIRLVCTGKDFTKDEIAFFSKEDVKDKIIHYQPADDEMPNVYKNALCFIYPSQYEGFGIPILEAYKYKCPVLINRKSCFPEIAKDAAIYFNLDSNESDLESILDLFLSYDIDKKQSLIDKQTNRLKDFSWKKSAEQLIKVYQKVL